MKSFKNKLLTLTKLVDNAFDGNHPNGINKGYALTGYCREDEIKVGEQLFLYPLTDRGLYPISWTSRVKKVDLHKMLIHTENSIYKLEVK